MPDLLQTAIRLVIGLLALAATTPALACTHTTSAPADAGSVSPAAINAAAVPAIKVAAGLSCTPSVIVVLGGNFIRAKFHSNNGLVLKRALGGSITYTASADPNATVAFTQDKTVDYMQNNLLNLLGLLGGSSANLPIYLKPSGGATPVAGTYVDRIIVTWDWYLCPGIGALGACVGTLDQGSAKVTTIDVTLDVSAKGMVITTVAQTTWDPVSGTSRPRALPGSKRRWTVSAYNPDLVPLDRNGVAVTVPIAAGELLALDGDGTGSSGVFALTDGSPASGLTLTYASPGSTSDDVDFSADSGATWSYVPVAGDTASLAKVTHVRLRPQGVMAAGSRVSVSVPTVIR